MAENKYIVRTYNKIADIGIKRFKPNYKISESATNPDAIMLRSFNLHDEQIDSSVMAVGRAGAGVNNIPIDKLSDDGVVVFNAPGANANSVKELVLAGMLLASRNLAGALEYVKNLSGDDLKDQVEAGKKKFVGHELSGKTLGVIGLGAIGYRVANAGLDLGMNVQGYDPAMTIRNARELSSAVHVAEDLEEVISTSDYLTIHVPLLDSTKGMLDKRKIALLKQDATLLNFSRDELVDETALVKALDKGQLQYYVSDFPNRLTQSHNKVIALPHLGASTAEAEDNCAVMIADQLQNFLENGNIHNSVNLPNATMSRKGSLRLTFVHDNKPGVVAQISNILSTEKINILDLLNRSRGELAYTIVDLEISELKSDTTQKLQAIPELRRLRIIK